MIPKREELARDLMTYFKVPDHIINGPIVPLKAVDRNASPATIDEAMKSEYAKYWALAIIDEWLSILGNNTWELIKKEPWMKIIPCKWVLKVKIDENNVPTKFKARLVAGGHRQTEGVDYDETYAPVSRMATLRTMISIAAYRKWEIHQLDIKTAFLHGKVDKDVYMKQPRGFIDGGDEWVCKLQKCLYGLKQAPKAWYDKLCEVLNECGFEPVSADSSFWVNSKEESIVYLASIVDDMLVTSRDKEHTKKVIKAILAILPGEYNGKSRFYNGMCMTWLKDGSVVLTQSGHVDRILEKFDKDGKLALHNLPMKAGLRLCRAGSSDNMESPPLDLIKFHYRALLGAISYVACSTRPDIAFAVNQLAHYLNAPTQEHWNILMGVLGYLKHTKYWGIRLGVPNSSKTSINVKNMDQPDLAQPDVVGYSDANHGTGIDDKRAVSGTVCKVFGGPVMWGSKVQSVTSPSSCESEFRAFSAISRDALWLQKILRMFEVPCTPFEIRGDNQSAIVSIKSYNLTKHTRHVEIHHDFMRDRYALGELDYKWVKGIHNFADMLTKALPFPQFKVFRDKIGMVDLSQFVQR
jgi:histone deacetylase 1/2